jgi:hypothetical protein
VVAYGAAPTLALPDGLDDRARNIIEPLFAVAVVAQGKSTDEITETLRTAVNQIRLLDGMVEAP